MLTARLDATFVAVDNDNPEREQGLVAGESGVWRVAAYSIVCQDWRD